MIKITVTEEGIPMVWNVEDWEKLRTEFRILGSLSGTLANSPSQEKYHGLPLVLFPYEVTLLREKKIARLVRYPSLNRAPGKGVKEEYEKYCERICEEQISSLMIMQNESGNNKIQMNEEQPVLPKAPKLGRRTRTRPRAADDVNSTCYSTLLNIAVEKLEAQQLEEFMPILNSLCVQTFSTYPWLRKEDACSVKWKYPSTSMENLRFKVFTDFWEKGHYVSPGNKFGADFLVYPGDPFVYSAHYLVICIERNAAIRPVDVAVLSRLGSTMCKSVILACETNSNEINYQTLKSSFLCE